MNKLAYGLLGFLSTESLSGYDLMLKLNQFWNTTHSAIYPLLSELLEKEYVTVNIIEQCGKPDKKIYNITEQGSNALLEWLMGKTTDPVVKDEVMLKIYCLHVLDNDKAVSLIDKIEQRYQERIERYTDSLNRLKNLETENIKSPDSRKFGAYILVNKVINEAKLGIEWCNWVREFYDEFDTNNNQG